MKAKAILLSALALILFVGCEKNIEPDDYSNESYLTVKLISPSDASTRGSQGGNTPGTGGETGVDQESKIVDAQFYFYDAAGNFVVKGETVSDLGTTTQTPGNNVERKSEITIVLQNVTVKPDQMFVVLNLPGTDDVFKNKSLTEAQALATEFYKDGDYFTMTSTTYIKKDETNPVIFTTRNIKDNLQPTEAQAKNTPVSAYVERLAVKGTITIDHEDEYNGTPVTAAVVGDANKVMTIEVLGWGFSNVNKQTYYIKKINQNWNFDWSWDDYSSGTWQSHYRTFWAQDANYTDGVYPVNYADLRDEGGTDAITPATASLVYKSFNDITPTTWREADYCLENTISGNLLKGEQYLTAATNMLVTARVKPSDAATYVTLYRFNGIFYTWDQYANNLASILNAQGLKKADNNSPYVAADFQTPDPANSTTFTNLYDGLVVPLFKTNLNPAPSNDAIAYLADAANNGARFATKVYTDGKMYYSIPIEHFSDPIWDKDHSTVAFKEGDFGVVRNHWYQVTVTDILKVGNGVFDVDEPIVPSYDPSTYYLAAELNILAWKIVTQSVTL